MRGRRSFYVAGGVDFNLDLVADMQEEIAWILEPPFHVRDHKVNRKLNLWAVLDDFDGKRYVMVLPVESKPARYFYFGCSLRRQRTLDVRWRENNFRKLGAFQDFAVHPRVAAAVATLGTGRIHHDSTADFVAARIEADRAAHQGKCSMNRVQSAAEREFDLCLRGFHLNDGILGNGGRRVQKGEQTRETRERGWKSESQTEMDIANHLLYARMSFQPKSAISATLNEERGAVSE